MQILYCSSFVRKCWAKCKACNPRFTSKQLKHPKPKQSTAESSPLCTFSHLASELWEVGVAATRPTSPMASPWSQVDPSLSHYCRGNIRIFHGITEATASVPSVPALSVSVGLFRHMPSSESELERSTDSFSPGGPPWPRASRRSLQPFEPGKKDSLNRLPGWNSRER